MAIDVTTVCECVSRFFVLLRSWELRVGCGSRCARRERENFLYYGKSEMRGLGSCGVSGGQVSSASIEC